MKKKVLKTTFCGVNDIHTIQYTYSDVSETNVVYVGIDAQTNKNKEVQDMILMFSKEQVLEIYHTMMLQEIHNSEHLL